MSISRLVNNLLCLTAPDWLATLQKRTYVFDSESNKTRLTKTTHLISPYPFQPDVVVVPPVNMCRLLLNGQLSEVESLILQGELLIAKTTESYSERTEHLT